MKKTGWMIACLCSQLATAQPFIDVAHLGFQQWDQGGEAAATSWLTGSLTVPVRSGAHVWLPAAAFERYEIGGLRVYGLSAPLGYIRTLDERWKIGGWIIPRLSSDLEGVTGDDYQWGAAVLLTRKKNERMSFRFGAYANTEFFGLYLLPLAGIEWKVSDRLNIGGVLPRKMTLEYKAVPSKLHLGLVYQAVTNSFRTDPDRYLRVFDNQLRLFLDAYLMEHLVVNLEAGRSFFRKYESGIRLSGKNTETVLSPGDRVLFRVSVAYRIRLDG